MNLGHQAFSGPNSAGETVEYARVEGFSRNTNATQEAGGLKLYTRGSPSNALTPIVVDDSGIDLTAGPFDVLVANGRGYKCQRSSDGVAEFVISLNPHGDGSDNLDVHPGSKGSVRIYVGNAAGTGGLCCGVFVLGTGNLGLGVNMARSTITERLTLDNDHYVGAVNGAGTAAVKLLGLDSSDAVRLAPGGQDVAVGASPAQRIGFHGAEPIAQRAGAAQAAVSTAPATQATPFGFATAEQANAVVTLLNELRAWAVAQGFIKGSA